MQTDDGAAEQQHEQEPPPPQDAPLPAGVGQQQQPQPQPQTQQQQKISFDKLMFTAGMDASNFQTVCRRRPLLSTSSAR